MYYKIINPKKRIVTRSLDLAGYALFAPVNLLRPKHIKKENIRKILVVRTAYIGDVIMTMPVLKPLREMFPDAKITFLACKGAEGLLANNKYIDNVIAFDAFWFYPKSSKKEYFSLLEKLREEGYDLVIEARADIRDILMIAYLGRIKYRLSYNVAGGGFLLTHTVPFERIKHKVEYHLDLIRFLGAYIGRDDIDWGLRPFEKDFKKAGELLSRGGAGKILVGIHPGGRKELKCWDKEKFALLADRLIKELGAKVFFTGAGAESALIEDILKMMRSKAVNLAGETDIMESAALVGGLDLFITNDSAPLHIASAMNTPTVAIFGPSKSNETGPFGNVHKVVEKDFPCRYACDEDVCDHNPRKECMDSIKVEDVYDAALEVLEKSGKSRN